MRPFLYRHSPATGSFRARKCSHLQAPTALLPRSPASIFCRYAVTVCGCGMFERSARREKPDTKKRLRAAPREICER